MLILCNKLGSLPKVHLLHTEVTWLSEEKDLHDLNFKPNKPFFSLVYIKSYPADILSKIHEGSLLLQGKQLKVFAANDKIQVFKQKKNRTLDNLTLPP